MSFETLSYLIDDYELGDDVLHSEQRENERVARMPESENKHWGIINRRITEFGPAYLALNAPINSNA